MTNFTEQSQWESGIYQLDVTDPVQGGAPGFNAGVPVSGFANAAAKQLTNRTKWLYDNKANLSDLASDSGSSLIGFKQDGVGAVSRTTADKFKEYTSVKDFGAVGDGVTDDTEAIQKAIDYVYAIGGGVVLVTHGVFVFTSILLKTGVTLRGNGGVLKLKDGVCNNASTTYYLIHNTGHSNVTYDNLIVDGNGANNSLFLVADAVTCSGEGSRVIDCEITNPPDSGIMFSIAPYSRCSGNRVSGGRDLGIYVNGNNNTDKTGIQSSIVSDNIVSGAPLGGIGIKRSTGFVVVCGNVIDNCGNGITVEDSTGGVNPESIVICNNIMRRVGAINPSTAQTGIYISKLKNGSVYGNHIYDADGYGIYGRSLDGVIVSCNIVNGNISGSSTKPLGHSGIVLDDSANGNIKTAVNGNIVSGFRNRSITASAMVRSSIDGNTVEGDLINGVTTGSGHQGIVLVNGSSVLSNEVSVCGNKVFGFLSNGMNINGCGNSVVSANIIDTVGAASAYALRVGSLVINCVISNNILKADSSALQVNYTSGASSNLYEKNSLNSSSGLSKFVTVNSSIASPVGVVTPSWEQQEYVTTVGGYKIWRSYGLSSSDWLQIG